MLSSKNKGLISDAIPTARQILAILLPITFPNAMPLKPVIDAFILTAASGALVPIAAKVSPIKSGETLQYIAIFEAPSIKNQPLLLIIQKKLLNKYKAYLY